MKLLDALSQLSEAKIIKDLEAQKVPEDIVEAITDLVSYCSNTVRPWVALTKAEAKIFEKGFYPDFPKYYNYYFLQGITKKGLSIGAFILSVPATESIVYPLGISPDKIDSQNYIAEVIFVAWETASPHGTDLKVELEQANKAREHHSLEVQYKLLVKLRKDGREVWIKDLNKKLVQFCRKEVSRQESDEQLYNAVSQLLPLGPIRDSSNKFTYTVTKPITPTPGRSVLATVQADLPLVGNQLFKAKISKLEDQGDSGISIELFVDSVTLKALDRAKMNPVTFKPALSLGVNKMILPESDLEGYIKDGVSTSIQAFVYALGYDNAEKPFYVNGSLYPLGTYLNGGISLKAEAIKIANESLEDSIKSFKAILDKSRTPYVLGSDNEFCICASRNDVKKVVNHCINSSSTLSNLLMKKLVRLLKKQLGKTPAIYAK